MKWMALALLAALLGTPPAVPAATFKAPDGFTFDYPDGWNCNLSVNESADKPGSQTPSARPS